VSVGFGLLDRYVTRRFVGAYGLCLLGFIGLFLVVDLSGNLADLLDARAHIESGGRSVTGAAVVYYLSKLPTIVVFVGPFLTLFAAIAALIGLSRHGELTPMVTSGRSLQRVLLPVYVLSTLLVLALFVVEDDLVPLSNRRHEEIRQLLDRKGDLQHVDAFTAEGNNFEVRGWQPQAQTLVGVQCRKWRDPDARLPEGALTLDSIEYGRHAVTGTVGWFPRGGRLRPFGLDDGRPRAPVELSFDQPLNLGVTPAEIELMTAQKRSGLARADIVRLMNRQPQNRHLEIELHTRGARPLASLVLLLLGLPFVARVGARSIAAGLSVAFVTSLAYFLVGLFFLELGNRGDLSPFAAVWIPPAGFGAFALTRLPRMAT
jgi:lipopolysaccharide export system permease protein